RRAAHRARGEPRPVVGAPGVSGAGSRPRVRLHDGPDRRRRAGGGRARARDARQRPVGAHRGQPGGRGPDGDERGVESGAERRRCHAHRRDRAARRRSGTRVSEASDPGAGRGADVRRRAGRRPGPRRGPADERGDRARGRRRTRRPVRSRGAGRVVSGARVVRAPRGAERSCRGWIQEAAVRMLMNTLDPEVAERPDDLVVYGGTGKAARDWDSFDAICRTLRTLADDETLLVQSGKPVGVFTTHPEAPRVLIANANLVGRWATWDVFRDLERRGLIMFGQMTAGSWIYIGTQGILQGTYETFGAVARRHFGGSLKGRVVLTGGLGGMGGAQPLAATMNEGVLLAVEVDAGRVRRRLETGYLDEVADSLDAALRAVAADAGVTDAFAIPGFVPEYIRPLFCEGRGPFRWVALSGDAKDLHRTDRLVLELFPENEHLRRWITLAQQRVQFQGLPARICWLGMGERARFGVALNDLVRRGELGAPIVIGRDHLDTGSVASPFRETEAMRDGSDAIADWPILN